MCKLIILKNPHPVENSRPDDVISFRNGRLSDSEVEKWKCGAAFNISTHHWREYFLLLSHLFM